MADKTGIEWTRSDDGTPGATWNPTTGCDRVSPGCDNCYALRQARRLKSVGSVKYQRDGDPRTSGPGFGLTVHPDTLDQPLRWRRPRRIFVDSMSDLFHDQVPDTFLLQVFSVMQRAPQHTFQVLTKRHGRTRSVMPWLERKLTEDGQAWPLPNVWLGTSVEDQKRADLRIPALMQTPATVRFISAEPLLGPVTLTHLHTHCPTHDFSGGFCVGPCPDRRRPDWVIVGGESGKGARPMHPEWARSLRDQCTKANIAYLFKQWGEWAPDADNPSEGNGRRLRHSRVYLHPDGTEAQLSDGKGPGTRMDRVGKHAAGRHLDGQLWDQYPVAAP